MASLNIKHHRVYKRQQQGCGGSVTLHVSTSENKSELDQCVTDEEIEKLCHDGTTDNSSIQYDSLSESDFEEVSEAESAASGDKVTTQVCASAEITTSVHTSIWNQPHLLWMLFLPVE